MVDNTTLNLGTGGDVCASDDIGGVKFQRVKLIHGADGVNAGDVATANGLPVVQVSNSLVSTANSTAVNLAGAAVFTGTSEDVSEYSNIAVTVFSSHASATDGLSMQQSADGTNWDNADVYTVPAASGKIFQLGVAARFYRLVYTNGATLTTSLRIQTIFSKATKRGSSVRPSDGRGNDNDLEEVSAFLAGYNGVSWDRLRSTTANGLAVDVTRLPALAAGAALIGVVRNGDGTNNVAIKPASTAAVFTDPALTVAVRPGGALVTTSAALGDAVTNPTIGLQAALLSVYNGTTWDRLRGTIANGIAVDVTRHPTLTKGTQGATGVSTQDLKDAGRVIFSAATAVAGVTAVTAEALLTLTPARDGILGTSASSHTVTSAKRLRIQAITVGLISTGASVLSGRIVLRMTFTGAVTTTSPIIAIAALESGPAVAQSGSSMTIPIPDGLEFSGTHQFGITQVCSAATGTVWASVIGYEY